jgi:hypothetical protein
MAARSEGKVLSQGRQVVLRFTGENGRGPEGLTTKNGNGSPSAAASDAAASSSRRLGIFVHPLRRKGRRPGSELVSQQWTPAEELQLELDRSRRFGHHFGLICISSRRGIESRWGSFRDLALGVRSLLRRVDRVWIDGTGVYLLLPECDRTMVEAFLERLREPLSRLLVENERSEISSAVFPEDGLTSGALISALKANRHTPEYVGTDHRSTPAA